MVVQSEVALLMKNQNPVKEKAASIKAVPSKDFWSAVRVAKLEYIRGDLRDILKYQQQTQTARLNPQLFDIKEENVTVTNYTPSSKG